MGQKVRGNLDRFLSRQTAQTVSRKSPCPVLLIPEREMANAVS